MGLPSSGKVSPVPSCAPIPVLALSAPAVAAVAGRVLLSSRCLPRLLVPLSTGDLSQLMLLNYKTGLVMIIISRDRNKRGGFWLVS